MFTAMIVATVAADDKSSPPHWVYSKHGVSDEKAQHDTWGAWGATCPVGRMQSPINIVTQDVAASKHLSGGVVPSFEPMPLSLKNSGHGFQAEPAPGAPKSHTTIRGDNFAFVQVHWHAPSEHTIDGSHAAMEGHFVHQSTDSNTAPYLAVVGVLFEKTESCNPSLEKFWDAFPVDGTVCGAGCTPQGKPTDAVDLTELLMPALADGYFHYTGSLTTPPCTEGVDWNLAKGVLSVCQAQLDRLKMGLQKVQDGVGFNNRATQPVYQRDVTVTPGANPPSFDALAMYTAMPSRTLISSVKSLQPGSHGTSTFLAVFVAAAVVAALVIANVTLKRKRQKMLNTPLLDDDPALYERA